MYSTWIALAAEQTAGFDWSPLLAALGGAVVTGGFLLGGNSLNQRGNRKLAEAQGIRDLNRWHRELRRTSYVDCVVASEKLRDMTEPLGRVLPSIRAKAKADNAEVLFGDQVGIRSDQVTGRTWGAKGATPVVRRTGSRFSVNAMSAISTRGRMRFMVFTETFDAKVMCRFLTRLVGHFDRKVHLIVDR
ncbi:transposase, partial [Streptomyces sp. NPDC091278]|uniref:transposase n=1 Tax=Streptomyces sp. NPDC091278 TaxID=3155301 RepID=UPI00344BFC20